MRVWIISQFAVPRQYGFGSRPFSLADACRDLGHQVHVFGASENHLFRLPHRVDAPYGYEQLDELRCVWLPTRSAGNRYGWSRLLKWLEFWYRLQKLPWSRFEAPQLIVYSSPSLLPALILDRLRRLFPQAQLVLDIRDLWPLSLRCLSRISDAHLLYRTLDAIERRVLRRVDAVWTAMPAAHSYLESRMRAPKPIRWLPHGVDRRLHFPKMGLPSRLRAWTDERAFTVVYAGSMGRANGLDNLCSAAALLEPRCPGIQFLLVGEGPLKSQLRHRAQALSNLRFGDQIDRAAVLPLLKRCQLAFDGFQDCELYRYGFSRNKWVDYAMAGLPIVAAYRGYPNLIDRAGCGVNVPPGDPHALAEAIERFFYLSVAKRRCIGARGKAYVLQHRRYESMLAELLAVDGLTQQD